MASTDKFIESGLTYDDVLLVPARSSVLRERLIFARNFQEISL